MKSKEILSDEVVALQVARIKSLAKLKKEFFESEDNFETSVRILENQFEEQGLGALSQADQDWIAAQRSYAFWQPNFLDHFANKVKTIVKELKNPRRD